jgi:hypothetical protein
MGEFQGQTLTVWQLRKDFIMEAMEDNSQHIPIMVLIITLYKITTWLGEPYFAIGDLALENSLWRTHFGELASENSLWRTHFGEIASENSLWITLSPGSCFCFSPKVFVLLRFFSHRPFTLT